jgi:predicted dehydrogenase
VGPSREARRRAIHSVKPTGFPAADDLESLADNPQVEALILITPPNARQDIVALFADRGKHILSEKPLERGLPQALAIVETCDRAGVRLGVVFQHRFRAASETLAELIQSGKLGPVRVVRANVPWWRDQAYYDEPGRGSYARDGGGVLISQAIHTLDLMLSLTGPGCVGAGDMRHHTPASDGGRGRHGRSDAVCQWRCRDALCQHRQLPG